MGVDMPSIHQKHCAEGLALQCFSLYSVCTCVCMERGITTKQYNVHGMGVGSF